MLSTLKRKFCKQLFTVVSSVLCIAVCILQKLLSLTEKCFVYTAPVHLALGRHISLLRHGQGKANFVVSSVQRYYIQ